jgi:hypothetical protein
VRRDLTDIVLGSRSDLVWSIAGDHKRMSYTFERLHDTSVQNRELSSDLLSVKVVSRHLLSISVISTLSAPLLML